ncbi:MAG: hypothetical protein VYA23_02045 [Candidatus Thermoplasmatota archaeon]|nr:hypothetical protein [Candidatus Thermoplasmatota archaeon]
MRDITARSVKLNRDLDKMLLQALERDLLVRIGWGKQGDEKPKNGEIGVITHLPEKSRVLLLGDLGECAGAMNDGGTFTLQGSCSSMLGAFQKSGRITIEKDAGDRVGQKMLGGEIIVQGSVGHETGAEMNGGFVIVRGHAGSATGASMSGGTVIILGNTGNDPGIGMTGGRVIISGSCPPPGDGATMREITSNELEEFANHLEPLGLYIDSDALVIVPSDELSKEAEPPETSVSEGFEGITLVPSARDRLPTHSQIDTSFAIHPAGQDENPLEMPMAWIISSENMIGNAGTYTMNQPALVTSKPRPNDLVLVTEENLLEVVRIIHQCSGMVLDLTKMPAINDAEIEALLVSLYSRMADNSLVFLKDTISRVEHLFRLVVDLDLDGAIVDLASAGGSRAAAALPRIGLVSQAMNLPNQGRKILLQMHEPPSAEDLLITIGAGCSAIVAPSPDDSEAALNSIDGTLRGWMLELGINNLKELTRRNLRAQNHDTAAISGLRLIGYDRPLPMWLKN